MAVSFAAGAGLADTVGATRDGGSLRGLAASRPPQSPRGGQRREGRGLADARRTQGARLLINPRLAAATSGPTLAWYARLIGASDEAVKADLVALPSMLDRVDGWIAGGVLGADQPSAADFSDRYEPRLANDGRGAAT
jgi:hypothetical protein